MLDNLREALKLLDNLKELTYVENVEETLHIHKLIDDLILKIEENLCWRERVKYNENI